jgi:flavin reductase (DIM6/NTAB) family NADH-FMN oxidoreductase RutF
MEELLHDLVAHNLSSKTVGIIENGSWSPVAGKLIRAMLEPCKTVRILDEQVTIKSAMKPENEPAMDTLIEKIAADFVKAVPAQNDSAIDVKALFKISYGLYVLTANENGKDNGCIINTAIQAASEPLRVSICVNKANYTHDMILRTGAFNLSFLTEDSKFATYRNFGFQSGRDADKLEKVSFRRAANGVAYLTEEVNAYLSGRVVQSIDLGSHTMFLAEVTGGEVLSRAPSVSYAYYFANIKPKPQVLPEAERKGWICTVCGYIYEGEALPADYICPICKHPASDFQKL